MQGLGDKRWRERAGATKPCELAKGWGALIAQGRPVLAESPHVAMLPALALFATVLALNVMGDALRKRDDTRGAAL